jgi:uncharacterized surface protein with fasciclin (FAS1) repeats
MKRDYLKLNGLLKFNWILFLAVFVFFATSCEEDSTVVPDDQAMAFQENDEASDLSARRAPAPGDETIVDIALSAATDPSDPLYEEFTQLVAALTYVDEPPLEAGLLPLLSGTNQFTVFAPTDDAFNDLYVALSGILGETIDEITDLPQALVLDVLKYHVTNGRRASNSVVPRNNQRFIQTLLGVKFAVNPDLSIEAVGNTANIVNPFFDISASNGIIHVIDAVILPIDPSILAPETP